MTTQEAQRACMERLTKRMEASPTDECAGSQRFETTAKHETGAGKMEQETFRYEQDPGHGWVEVPAFMLHKLEIADRITYYSYVRGDLVYLEEDQDLDTFLRAYRTHYGQDPELNPVYVDHTPIRRFARYHAPDYVDEATLPADDGELFVTPQAPRELSLPRNYSEPDLIFPEHYAQISDADSGL